MKPLNYTTSKKYGRYRIDVFVKLADECKNGNCDFSITADIYEQHKNGKYAWFSGGCQHEEILKHFPEFSDFVALHLCNSKGQPMYCVENSLYFLKKGTKEGAEYMRISEELASQLETEDSDYFKYRLVSLGITKQWEEEAKKAIAHLESLCGYTFEDYESPRFTFSLSDEERDKIEELIRAGYYKPQARKERREKAEKERRTQERRKIEDRYDKEIEKARTEKQIMLAVFDMFGTADNVIYYAHKNEICFNWIEHGFRWEERQIRKFFREFLKESVFPNYFIPAVTDNGKLING